MKKPLQKIVNAFQKIRRGKDRVRKLRFSGYQEDFVITEQEEKEGGFFGSFKFNMFSHLK